MDGRYLPLSQQHHAYARPYSPNSSIHPSESASNVVSAQNIAHQQAMALAKAQAQIRTRQAQLPFASEPYPYAQHSQTQEASLPNPSQFFSQQQQQPTNQQLQFQSSQFFPLDNPSMSLPLPPPLPMPNSSSNFAVGLANHQQQPSLPYQHSTQESQHYHSQFSTNQLPLSSTLVQMQHPNQPHSSFGDYAIQPLSQQQQQQQDQPQQSNDLNPSEKWGKFFAQDNDEDDATDMVSPVHALPGGATHVMAYQYYESANNGSDVGYTGGANGTTSNAVSFYPQGQSVVSGMRQQQQEQHSSSRIPPRLKHTSMPYTTHDGPYSARLQESRQFFNDEPIPPTPQSNVSANFALLTVLDDIKKDASAREYGLAQQRQFQYQQQHHQQQYEDHGNSSALSMNSQAGHSQLYSHECSGGKGGGEDGVNSPTTSALGCGSSGPGPKGVFTCTQPGCTKSFDRVQKLKSHVVSHKVERPFICGFCNLAFQRNHDLTRHMRLHTNEKPHKCRNW
ncbi:zinc-finger protein [Podochytrium sp. JEL0797]|nr:zinc-finger protein [Podochytrium sp. JEL0797]